MNLQSFQENPGVKINFGEFSKLCGQKWQTMGEEDRVDYEKKAADVSILALLWNIK